MIKYIFNKEKGIVETEIIGITTISDFYKYFMALSEDQNLPKILKIFTDGSKGKFDSNVSPEDMIKLAEANKISLEKREKVYTASVISSSIEMAMGFLYKEFSERQNYEFELFSTKEEALHWLCLK